MAATLTNKAGVSPIVPSLEVKDRRRFEDNGNPKSPTEPQFDVFPRHDLVLIRQVVREEVEKDGVIAPGADFFLMKGDDKSQRGIVIKAGPKSDLVEGDLVLFTAFPMEIEGMKELTGDDRIKLVRDEEVYARVKSKCPQ